MSSFAPPSSPNISNPFQPSRSYAKEIRSLTSLRGVAAVYVVLHHYLWFNKTKSHSLLTTFLGHGYLAVDLFFILSGFVMALNYAHMFEGGYSGVSFAKFLGRRIARVYPLYIAATVAASVLILLGVLQTPGMGMLKWSTFAANAAMVQGWGLAPSIDWPSWSISAEWAAYLVFPVILSLAYFRHSVLAWLCGAVSVVAIFALSRTGAALPTSVGPLDITGFAHGISLWRCLPEFTLGILTARVYQWFSGRSSEVFRWLGPAAALLAVLLLLLHRTDVAFVLLCPILILWLSSMQSGTERVLSSPGLHRLGELSYSIYLIHALLAGVLYRMHAALHDRGVKHAEGVALLLLVPAIYVLSEIGYRFVEKPGRAFLRDMFEGRQVPNR